MKKNKFPIYKYGRQFKNELLADDWQYSDAVQGIITYEMWFEELESIQMQLLMNSPFPLRVIAGSHDKQGYGIIAYIDVNPYELGYKSI